MEEKLSTLSAAMKYRAMGFSVIPLLPNDKRPAIKWEPYQKEIASEEALIAWFTQGFNIGIVTGELSNLTVVDCDSKDAILSVGPMLPPDVPAQRTPRGGRHFFFQYTRGFVNRAHIAPGVDIRTQGGYVAAYPSTTTNGGWNWKDGKSIFELSPPSMGTTFENLLRTWAGTSGRYRQSNNCQKNPTDTSTMFTGGQLDEDIFTVANSLTKGGMLPKQTEKVLEVLVRYGNENRSGRAPYSAENAREKIQSALRRFDRKERNLTQEIRNWVSVAPGVFYTRDMARDLDINCSNDQKTASAILIKMVKEGILEGSGKRGVYRIKEVGFEEMDFDIPEAKTIPLSWPLRVEELYRCYPGTVAVLAGAPESGKTTYCLNYCLQNMNNHNITYLSSELWGPELKSRILLFNRGTEIWKKAKFKKVISNFEDAIDPDGINIVDYIKIYDEFWLVAKAMQSISNKLKSGTALIALQRPYSREIAKGGEGTLEDPRLYLTMNRVKGEDFGKFKILKCHNWINPMINPNRMYKNFRIIKGNEIEEISPEWIRDEEKEESTYLKTMRGK